MLIKETAQMTESEKLAVRNSNSQYLETHLHDAADYVIAQGTDGVWTYRKWNSGNAECWGLHTIENLDITESARGSYYATRRINFPSGLFASGGSISANVNSGLSAGFAYNGISGVPYPSFLKVIFVCQTEMSNVSAWCNIHAIGKWK